MEASAPACPSCRSPSAGASSAQYDLPPEDALTLTASRSLAEFFEATVRTRRPLAPAANWILRDLLRLQHATGGELDTGHLTPAHLAAVIQLVEGPPSPAPAGEVLEEVFRTGADPQDIVPERGLAQVSDTGALSTIDAVLAQEPEGGRRLPGGKENAIMFLVGQVMKQTRGTADAGLVRRMLQPKLA